MPDKYGRFDGVISSLPRPGTIKSYLCASCDFATIQAWASACVLHEESKVCRDCTFNVIEKQNKGDTLCSQ